MRLSLAVLGFALLAIPAGAQQPGTAAPEAEGFSSARLAEVLLAIGERGVPIHSLLVERGERIILDAAFYPYDTATLHDMASVTKSVMTTLIGIAAAESKLDLDAPMLSFFPDREIANREPRKERITVRHLTQNLSGLACIGFPDETTLAEMEESRDFVQFALDLPMGAEPGTRFDYCSPGMHLLSAILQHATGETALTYATAKLFEPLGIADAAWDEDPQGITRGWGDLHLRPDDMARLGTLWLHRGRWNNSQLIPEDWLIDATTSAVTSDRYEDYGAGFWVGPASEPVPYFFASGRGGQRIVVAPSLDLVIVTTGGGFDPGTVIDPVVTTLLDPAAALPADPAGEAALTAAVAAAGAPPAGKPVPALPATAARIGGKTYDVEPNPYGLASIRLDFPGGSEATWTSVDAIGTAVRPVGLDGTYRWSVGENGVVHGARADWIDPGTLVLDYNTVGDIRAYTITVRFEGNDAGLTIVQHDEASTVVLSATAR
jgi:CubicO group peptidase (beta-lactamase class C family)